MAAKVEEPKLKEAVPNQEVAGSMQEGNEWKEKASSSNGRSPRGEFLRVLTSASRVWPYQIEQRRQRRQKLNKQQTNRSRQNSSSQLRQLRAYKTLTARFSSPTPAANPAASPAAKNPSVIIQRE